MFSSLEWTYFVSCVYVLQAFNGDDVVELCGDACFIIKFQCVVCDVDSYLLWNFSFEGKGNGELMIGEVDVAMLGKLFE